MSQDVDPTGRFTERVANYVKHRPAYPDAVIELLKDRCGLGPDAVVADVGSGTGILTRMLLQTGAVVWAIEPNDAMRRAAEADLAAFPRFHSLSAAAEAIPLAPGTIDLITAAQAFHWFDAAAAARSFLRVLTPTGRVALVWNARDYDGSDFMRAYEDVLEQVVPEYREVSWRNTVQDDPMDAFFGANQYERHTFSYLQRFDRDGLIGRFLSSSSAPKPDDPRHAPALGHLLAAFDAHAHEGHVTFAYRTLVFLGRPVA